MFDSGNVVFQPHEKTIQQKAPQLDKGHRVQSRHLVYFTMRL
ncbi:hypothetical protein SD77_3072 [Bacillus badius]|uniref:Ribose 5-phosphate isomerase B n=1 Tax=Bacillus badius TaxID=1455 RepID=A0ABR5AWT4_BACBA|nr:hypothetical protein SD78_0331 [Bacillus badius]KIL79206.1 hypothetical protein SD77_3072 [Bacillus badius]